MVQWHNEEITCSNAKNTQSRIFASADTRSLYTEGYVRMTESENTD